MATRNLLKAIRFVGSIERNGQSVKIPFSTNVSLTGELNLRFSRIPLSKKSAFIIRDRDHGERATRFSLTGKSKDGHIFNSDQFYFTTSGTRTTQSGSFLKPGGMCSSATITQALTSPTPIPVLRYHIRNFQCYQGYKEKCALGRIVLEGSTKIDNPDLVTGVLNIESATAPDDSEAWRNSATKLLDHIMLIMSFANGTRLRAPVIEFLYDKTHQIQIVREAKGTKPFRPAFHFLHLPEISSAAVSSFWGLETRKRKIAEAIEWMLMPVTYKEMRLLAGMIALENFATLHVENASRNLSSQATDLQAALRRKINESKLDQHEKNLFSRTVGQLNNLPLKDKIDSIIGEWSVPIGDFPPNAIRDLVSARSRIVHRGTYYDSGRNQDQQDLWEHISLLYELLTRIILSALEFRGNYQSHRGGQHLRNFPECTKLN